jgi:carboxyl-terminal processing protease
LFLFLLLAGTFLSFHSEKSAASTSSITVEEVPYVVSELLKRYPKSSGLDEDVLLSSRQRFISFFDPAKIYLLEEEVVQFTDPSDKKRFYQEFRRSVLRVYFEMVECFQRAIVRARATREAHKIYEKKDVDEILSTEVNLPYGSYASSPLELSNRFMYAYAKEVVQRLPSPYTTDELIRAVRVVEKEIILHENEWLLTRKRQSAIAQYIVKSIVSSLDVYSDVMGKDEATAIKERLTKESFGTGIVCGLTRDGWEIQKVILGSPADKGHEIAVHDRILSINGRSVNDLTDDEIREVLHSGTAGSVSLVLERDGKKIHTNVARKMFVIEEGRVDVQVRKTPEGNIAIFSLHSLYRGRPTVSSEEDLKKAFAEAEKSGPIKGVLLDLRDNGGGYLVEAVGVVGLFIKSGIVMQAVYGNGNRIIFRDLDPSCLFSGPMVVMTSFLTASSAEIVAQALQDYGRALVVGDPHTYGKGSIQMQTVTDEGDKTVSELPLRITVGRFYTVSGKSPSNGGVTADVVVPSLWIDHEPAFHGVGDPGEQVSPLYQDQLLDISGEAKGWYVNNYLPFLEEKTNRYRRWSNQIQKRSEERMKRNVLWSTLRQHVPSVEEQREIQKKAQQLQLDEGVSVLEDLMQLSGGKYTSFSSNPWVKPKFWLESCPCVQS